MDQRHILENKFETMRYLVENMIRRTMNKRKRNFKFKKRIKKFKYINHNDIKDIRLSTSELGKVLNEQAEMLKAEGILKAEILSKGDD